MGGWARFGVLCPLGPNTMTAGTNISVATGGGSCPTTGPGLDPEIPANPMRSVNTKWVEGVKDE